MTKEILGFLSVAFYTLSIVFYIRSVMRGQTRPHAFSWGIWALGGIIVCPAQLIEGAGPGAWLQATMTLLCCGVTWLGLTSCGDRSYRWQDWTALGFALAAVPLWYFSGTPL